MKRNRLIYGTMIALVILAGLMSRTIDGHLPNWVNAVLGDALWAVMIYLMTAFLLKNWHVWKVAIVSLGFCYAIELSQLYQADWILALRSTTLGGLMLGHAFLWSDILAYTIGVCLAAICEKTCFGTKTG